jgi:16S rRNA processing protein RimM
MITKEKIGKEKIVDSTQLISGGTTTSTSFPIFSFGSLFQLGKIIKTRHYDGQLFVVFDAQVSDDIEDLTNIFVLIDGLYVPYQIVEILLVTDTSAYLRLEFIENENNALEIVGCTLWTPQSFFKQKTKTEFDTWIGFEVFDLKRGKIGIIKKIENYKGNVVIQIINADKEILISFYPELLVQADIDAKVLHISALDGYFDENF